MEYSSEVIKGLVEKFKVATSTQERIEICDQFLNLNMTQEDILLIYGSWAKSYNTDHKDEENNGPQLMQDFVLKYCPNKDINVLDICCGTGIGAKFLSDLGYKAIDGIDGSKEMLEEAKELGIYRDLYYELLRVDRPIESIPQDRKYELIICAACFVKHHLNGNHLRHIVNKMSKGGVLIMTEFSVEEDELQVFKEIKELKEQGIVDMICLEKKNLYGAMTNFVVLLKLD